MYCNLLLRTMSVSILNCSSLVSVFGHLAELCLSQMDSMCDENTSSHTIGQGLFRF